MNVKTMSVSKDFQDSDMLILKKPTFKTVFFQGKILIQLHQCIHGMTSLKSSLFGILIINNVIFLTHKIIGT